MQRPFLLTFLLPCHDFLIPFLLPSHCFLLRFLSASVRFLLPLKNKLVNSEGVASIMPADVFVDAHV